MRLIFAASLLMLSVPGFAAPPAESKAKPQSNKKICRVDPEDTDSRIRRRICKTEAEWIAGRDDKSRVVEAGAAGSAGSGK